MEWQGREDQKNPGGKADRAEHQFPRDYCR